MSGRTYFPDEFLLIAGSFGVGRLNSRGYTVFADEMVSKLFRGEISVFLARRGRRAKRIET